MATQIEIVAGGGVDFGGVTSTVKLPRGKRAISVLPQGGTGTIKAPDARLLPVGRVIWVVFNASGSNTLAFRDANNTLIATIAVSTVSRISLADGSTKAGKWVLRGASGVQQQLNWYVPVGSRFWGPLQGDTRMEVGTATGTRRVDLDPAATLPPTGQLPVGARKVNLTQN